MTIEINNESGLEVDTTGLLRLADFVLEKLRIHPQAELSTDSRTGALGLYERVGMEVTSTWVNRAIDL